MTDGRGVALAATLLILTGSFDVPFPDVHPRSVEGSGHVRITWHPTQPPVGTVAWLDVQGVAAEASIEGSAGGRPLTFFPYGQGQAALVGIDVESRAGEIPWKLAILEPHGEPSSVHGRLTVRPRQFTVERLTLPPAMVDLDPETEQRAVREGERLRTLYRTISTQRMWRGPFVHPLGARTEGTNFGSRRIINGQPRAPHGGADYAAAQGTPVVAANAGRVALVAEFFFHGRLVAIDHGVGLYTLYFHLERAAVVEGQRIERGQMIGTVGSTGRATGPHLHFGVQVGSARVDPASLLTLGVRD